MRNLWVVIKKEYLEIVKTKGFFIGVVLAPLIMGAFMFIPSLLARKIKQEQLKLAVVDQAGWMYAKLDSVLADTLPDGKKAYLLSSIDYDSKTFEEEKKRLAQKILDGKLDAFLVIPFGIETGAPPQYYSKTAGNIIVRERLENRISDAVVARRLAERGVVLADLKKVLRGVEIESNQVSEKGTAKTSFFSVFLSSFFLVMILFSMVLSYGQHLARSIVEEKNTRIVEVLTSSATPFQLLMGKMLGLGAASLSQVGLMALLGFLLGAPALRWVGMENVQGIFNSTVVINFFVYVVLGYFLYTSIFAILGAISNSDQEVQNMTAPIVWAMVLPMVIGFVVAEKSNADWVTTLSLVPFFTPTLMMMRISFSPPPWSQLFASYAIMILTIMAMGWLAAKIFRVGILMYGKRPTLPELVRWVRYK